MKRRILCAVTLALASTAQAGVDDAWQVAEANIAQWNQAFANGRVDDIVSLYAADAMLVQPDGVVSKNTGQIRAFWQALIDNKGGIINIGIQDAKSEKDGTITTKTTLSDIRTLRNTQQVMKYDYDGVLYSVLKRQGDGSWKAIVQQWSHKGRS